mgnify:CR=1 FL=1
MLFTIEVYILVLKGIKLFNTCQAVWGVKKVTTKKRFKLRHLLLFLFLIYVVYTLATQYIQLWQLSRQEADVKGQLEEALVDMEGLKKEIELLHTANYIEKVARDELGLVKPGEYIFRNSKTLK